MVTLTQTRPRPRSEIPPARGCATCGRRDAWRKLRSGGWSCRRCEGLPKMEDDAGDPAVLRHSCDKMGCTLVAGDGEDEAEPIAIAPVPPAATISVTGDALIRCPDCRRWARVLSVATDGRLWCGRCPN